jgi:hypothetical protein
MRILFASALMVSSACLAMGPDPGGHTGATVTPETTRTDRTDVDAARKSASGSKTETNGSPQEPKQAPKK